MNCWFITQEANVHNLLIFVIIKKEDGFMHRIFYMEWTASGGIFLPSRMIVADVRMFWFLHCFFLNSIFQFNQSGFLHRENYYDFFLAKCLALKNLISIFHSIQDLHETKWDARPFCTPVISSVRRFSWSFFARDSSAGRCKRE